MKRDSFIFYASFKNAADTMSDSNRLAFYDAIVGYGLEGTEPKSLKNHVHSCWSLVQPILDSNNKKHADGSKGGRPSKTSGSGTDKTTGSKSSKPNEKEEEKEEDKEEDKEEGRRAAAPSRRSRKSPAEPVFESLSGGYERIGYTATEDLKKKQIAKLEQAVQHTTAKPPDDDAETRRLKQQFMQQLNPGIAAPANIPADTGPEKPAADSTQAPAPQPSGTQAHDQTGTPSQETSPQQEPQPPPG